MPAPVITNPYTAENKATAYLNEPFSVKLAVSNPPVLIDTREDWVGWSYRWIAAESMVELLVTPRRILTDEVGILLRATNPDGFDETRIPYAFISRIPVIADIPDQKWAKGQKDIDFIIPIRHQVNIVSVRGDHIGLGFDPSGEGVRIFGDLIKGELLKDRGTFTVSAVNDTGIATPKVGNWRMYPQPSAVRNLTVSSTRAGIVTLDWDAPIRNGGYRITNHQWKVGEEGDWTETKSANTLVKLPDAFEAGTYKFYVRPINAEGIIGVVAGPVSERVIRTTVPEGISGLSARVSATSIIWTWNAPANDGGAAIEGYRIAGDGSGTTTSTSYTLRGRKGRTYEITVTPYNSVGNGPTSSAVSATIPATAPGPVRNLTRNAATGTITWDAPLDNGGSPILYYQRSYDGGAWTSTATNYPADTPGRTHTYAVRAVNAVGAGPARSISWYVRPIVTAPSAPSSLIFPADIFPSSFFVRFSTSTNNGGAAIVRYEMQTRDWIRGLGGRTVISGWRTYWASGITGRYPTPNTNYRFLRNTHLRFAMEVRVRSYNGTFYSPWRQFTFTV